VTRNEQNSSNLQDDGHGDDHREVDDRGVHDRGDREGDDHRYDGREDDDYDDDPEGVSKTPSTRLNVSITPTDVQLLRRIPNQKKPKTMHG